MGRFRPIHASAAVAGCVIAAAAALFIINHGVPRPIETVLSVIAFPLFVIFVPLYPVFERMGMMAGELWRLPSTTGLVLGTLFYAAVAYIVASAVMRRR
jgi:hypothetical protein